MNLEKIVLMSGKPGLFLLKTKTKSGFILESLLDGKKTNANSQLGVSMLSEISVYTYEKEKSLTDIFTSILEKENKTALVFSKDDTAKLKTYFEEILPNYDKNRVYPSDIIKIFNWYNLLLSKDLL